MSTASLASSSAASLLQPAFTPATPATSTLSPLAGRNILVTSCSSTIGRAVCQELASRGANLVLTDTSREDGQSLCRRLEDSGYKGNLLLSIVEAKDTDRLAAYIKSVPKRLKRLDGAVIISTHMPEEDAFHRTKLQEAADIMDSNYKPAFTCAQACISQFEQQNDEKYAVPEGGYSIVNITSALSFNDRQSSYQCARQAIISLTQSIAAEYANVDIRANTISSGPVEEDVEGLGASFVTAIFASTSASASKSPMRRSARPVEVAKAAVFLLGPDSSYITGVDLPVDGGLAVSGR